MVQQENEMTRKPKKTAFGAMLCFYRGRTADEVTGKPFSQDKLADKLSEKTREIFTRNHISNWENGKMPPNFHDRSILMAIVEVLYVHKGIRTLAEANDLLAAGDYRILDREEVGKINVEWATQDQMGSPLPSENLPLPQKMSDPRPQLGPGMAPPVPSLIIGRDEDIRILKQNLKTTGQAESTIQILTAIKGWPGVGKTTIASALAYDPDILTSFPDGVLWVSLGQEPNLLSEMATWGRALGTEELLHAQTVKEAQAQLAALLRNKKMLLIIDDVWQPEHAVPFKVGGRRCATLITTRRDSVATTLAPTAAYIYRLKVLKDKDALLLLEQLAPGVVAKFPDECLVLVQELEGLPLALQVAGRLLHTETNCGFGVIELIEELRDGAKLLKAQAPADRADLVNETTPTVAALLHKSLDRLDQATRDCYAYLGVFAPKPATFDLAAMKFVWQVEDPKPIVRTLVDRGLLEFVPEIERYQMHALLVMLAKSLLTDEE
jgi:transcriptional regulator with XRE-family HTH domain